MSDDERRRFERIRQQQLESRSPGDSKIPGYDWSQHAQRRAQINKKQQRERGLRGVWLLTDGSIGLVVSPWSL